jgi:hypothetical protein
MMAAMTGALIGALMKGPPPLDPAVRTRILAPSCEDAR